MQVLSRAFTLESDTGVTVKRGGVATVTQDSDRELERGHTCVINTLPNALAGSY